MIAVCRRSEGDWTFRRPRAFTRVTMVRQEAPPDAAESPPSEFQFGLQALLMMFVLVAVLLSYLRPYGLPDMVRCSLLLVAALLCGGLMGLVARRLADALFWSAIGSICGYLAVLGAPLNHWTAQYFWPLAGGIVGATAACCGEGRRIRRAACCLLVGLGLVALYELSFFGFSGDRVAELVCAAGGSVLLALVVELAGRFEKYTAIPRHFLAIGFVLLAIAAHWAARKIIPGL